MMWQPLFYVLPLALSTLAIRVPVDGKEENATEPATADNKQDTFYIPDEASVDSYLIPPDPHRPIEVLPDIIVTPATYLLPPSPEKQIDYYAPTEAGDQTDWYPIAQVPHESTPVNLLLPQRQPDVIPIFLTNNQTLEILGNPRGGKAYYGDHIAIPVPSRQLEPPLENAPNDYIFTGPSNEQELPSTEINQPFNIPAPEHQVPVKPHRKNPKKIISSHFKPAEPTLSVHLTPPKPLSQKYKNPTKLYPKKVTKGFQPIPIPLAEFAEDTTEVPRAKPVKPFKPVSSDESEYYTPDEKNVFLYKQAEEKRKLKAEHEAQLQQPVAAAEDTYGVNVPTEQETSETNYRHPGRNVYPAPLRLPPPRAPASPQRAANAPTPPPGDRTEFRMHGMKGPHSYQFGYDTGKGKNRQFRYEERDNDGRVKGHYGYMDKNGKLRVVNYDADPEHGFHAEAPTDAQ
ncbi:uncharacterized protein LOC126366741 [Pectinophora gossypiella]|uniref:uncharacterized protein LOC126366741 n=1 Tax=Pectinophora gossypiella TaxID=13191 RepID=UPI00214EE496|nr:uncharacterized protein LOC126366741 [Pectinophora gossypiella]